MNATLGLVGVTLAVSASLAGMVSMVVGLLRHRRQLVRYGPIFAGLMLAGAALAVFALERAIITRDFTLAYVTKVGSSKTPALFNFAAMWSSLQGSLLLWGFILALYTLAVVRRFRRRLHDPLVGWALAVMLGVSSFFFLLLSGPANPFLTLAVPPLDGPGPNPLLQNHILVAFHPPILYLGYVGFTVPFAFAIAALITGRVGEGWLLETRRWTLFAWGFLTFGIVLGAWWAYEVLGWNGFWGWDPVENASLLPWLTGTAFIHSVLVQERRGMLRVWNLSLLCATFSLTILGTFLVRSGVVESVHSFSGGSVGAWILTFFGIIVVLSLGLMAWRGDQLRSPGAFDSPVSREGAFLVNNLLFALFAFVVLLGTVFPLIIEATQNKRLAVGRPFFDAMTMPIGLALLTLMAIAPVLPWRKASTELLRDRLFWPAVCGVAALGLSIILGGYGLAPLVAFGLGGFAAGAAGRQLVLATRRQGLRGLIGRANGGMIVHLGVIFLAVGLAASQSFAKTSEVSLAPGAHLTFEGHDIVYIGADKVTTKQQLANRARVLVDGKEYAPAQVQFFSNGQVLPRPSVRTRPWGDVYLNLTKPTAADGTANLQITSNPLVMWLWIGGIVMAFGTVLSMFPGKRRRLATDATSALVPSDDVAPDPVAV